jgi:hypothetical protein
MVPQKKFSHLVTELGTFSAVEGRWGFDSSMKFRSKLDQFVFDRENLGIVIAH